MYYSVESKIYIYKKLRNIYLKQKCFLNLQILPSQKNELVF